MYIFLQNLSTINILDPIYLWHVVSSIFVSEPPPKRKTYALLVHVNVRS